MKKLLKICWPLVPPAPRRITLTFLGAALFLACAKQKTIENDVRNLFEAAASGEVEIVEEIIARAPHLAKGSDIVFTRKTPLHEASSKEIAEIFLTAGADVHAVDAMGLTPLHTAKRPDIVDLLIKNGADVKDLGKVGATPLHMAVFPNVALALIKNGADINALSETRATPLYSQTLDNRYSVMRILLDSGANVTLAHQKSGETPLHIAARIGTTDTARLLIEHGAPLEAQDASGATPLMSAVIHERSFMVKLLLAKGAARASARALARTREMRQLLK